MTLSSIKPLLFGLLLLVLIIVFDSDFSQATSISSNIRKRNHEKNYYYAIELKDGSEIKPEDVANLLNIKHEGQIGALDDVHLFSSIKEQTDLKVTSRSVGSFESDESNDRVLVEFNKLKSKRRTTPSSLEKKSISIIDNILSVEKQKLRKRHKRVPIPEELKKLNKRKNTNNSFGISDITDPGFSNQWHLVISLVLPLLTNFPYK